MLGTPNLNPNRFLATALALLALLALLAGAAFAQGTEAAQAPAVDAGARADAAVEAWLAQEPLAFDQLATLDAEQLCREIPALLTNAAPPPGTQVRLDDRLEQPSDDPELRVFTYAAVRPGDQLDVVEVRLRERGADADVDPWTVEYVGFRSTLELSGVRAWLQTPVAAWTFVAFTLLVVMQLATRASTLRRWLAAGRATIREHRRLVIVTLALLYGVFALGAYFGSTLPDTCEQAIVDLVTSAVTTVGATEAYGSGNVARAAVTTFYQNYVVVTVSVTFALAALLGVPAYLFAALSFFTQAVPFGLLGGSGPLELVIVLVLLVLELTAYFLVVAGGGMLLATLFGRGENRFYRAYRKLLLMLPIAGLLLLLAAWYEAAVLVLLG